MLLMMLTRMMLMMMMMMNILVMLGRMVDIVEDFPLVVFVVEI